MKQITIKQRVFAFGATYDVYDENETQIYCAKSEILTFGSKIHINDMNDNEVCYCEQELFHFMPKYYLNFTNGENLEINGKFSLFKNKLEVEPISWFLEGSDWTHAFEITDGGILIASIDREWFTFGDQYTLKVTNDSDTLKVIALTIVLDSINDAKATAGAGTTVVNND